MKRILCSLLIVIVATSASSANKRILVQELKDKLISLQQEKKTDIEIASQLKAVELSEQLTRGTINGLQPLLPGPLTGAQIDILEGRSALLAPPASDLPAIAVPDIATQKALLSNAIKYVLQTYMQNPRMSASKTTARFQDGVDYIRTNTGVASGSADNNPSWAPPSTFMRLLGTHTAPVETEKGIETAPVAKGKVPWSQNGQTSEGGPGPILSVILQDAASGGKLKWLRWETIHDKPIAVFSFGVDQKKSRYSVNYCCFPITSSTGGLYYVPTANMQSGVDWKPFKAVVGYHGAFFIDPESGVVVRVTTQAELNPTDFVHQEDMRIDYGPVTIGDKTYTLPVDSFTLTEVVPNGDDYGAKYSVRHTLFTAAYEHYQLDGGSPAVKQ